MEENCAFGESCLNLALNKSLHFISAYPTKIVFGKCFPKGYIKSKCFQYQISELYKLYSAIFEVVKFFALTGSLEKELVLSKCNQNYFLVGKILWINDKEEKVGVFGIEELSEDNVYSIVYELFFTDIELNEFIYALIKVIPSSLCLTSQEIILFQKASKASSKEIILLREEKHSKQFIKKFLKDFEKELSDEILDVSIYNLSTFLTYYCEIILISHKVQTLLNIELPFDNIRTIITKDVD
jgi:hypothetical protein